MSIRQRITIGFAAILSIILLFVFVTIRLMAGMNENTEEIGNSLYVKAQYASDIQVTVGRMNEALANMLILQTPDEQLETIEQSKETLLGIHEELSIGVTSERGKELYGEATRIYGEFDAAASHYINLIRNGEFELARDYLISDVQPLETLLRTNLDVFTNYQEQLMNDQVAASASQNRSAQTIMWIGLVALASFCVATAMWVVNSTVRSIRSISDVMNQVHELDSSSSLPRMAFRPTEELGAIVESFNSMAAALEDFSKREAEQHLGLQNQNWIKSNIAAVMNACQGARTIDVFGKRLLDHIVPEVSAIAGALYYADPNRSPADGYERVAAYALDPEGGTIRPAFRIGEGLVGQCAADGRPIMRTAPPGYLRVVSGLGEGDASFVFLLPIRFENTVVAVLEMGSFAPLEPLAREFLEELASGSIGVSLNNLAATMRVQTLLTESQTYIEELQTQSEELQQQQEELRTLNEKLAEQFRYAEQRGNELERIRSELEEKALELQASSQFKSEFLANMSHELRTPLNSLLILAQMLGDDPDGRLTEKQREYARTILCSGNELLALINDVLDLSKIEAGQMLLEEEPFSLGEFVEDLERQFRGVAEQKSLSFDVSAEAGAASAVFVSDSRMLQQILNNLLSNAFKFTESGEVALRVFEEKAAAEAGEPLIVFEVRDTGIGIPSGKQDMIFEAFRQADSKTTRKYGGTGLGLSISRELTRILGGEIKLESEEGRGSTFAVAVPMKRFAEDGGAEAAAALAPAGARARDSSPGEPAPDESARRKGSSNGKILIVDDDIRNVYALSAALSEQQYEVIYAEDGAAALEQLEREPDVDLVLMDMMMPVVDGYEATRLIRSDSRFEKLPVIALTAKAMKQDRELCLEAGANDYLSKPVKLDKLLSLLRVWIDGAEGRQ